MGQIASRTDPHKVAQIVTELVELAGGAEPLAEMTGRSTVTIYKLRSGSHSRMRSDTAAALAQAAAELERLDLAADLLVALGIPVSVIEDELLEALGVAVDATTPPHPGN
jgi:hypothetical protein